MIALKPISYFAPSKNNPLTKEGIIGLDLTVEKVNLVQLGVLEGGSIAVKEYCSIPFTSTREEIVGSPKNLRSILRQAFKSHKFSGHKVVTSIPSHDVRIISVNYPKPKSIADTSPIISAIGERINEDLSEYVIDYVPVRSAENDDEQLAIVALVKNEIVMKYLEAYRFAGLEVDALEIRPSAINRYVYASLEGDNFDNILAINFGEKYSYLTITSGRRLLFDHQIEFGSSKIIANISTTLDIPEDSVLQLIEQHGFDEAAYEKSPKLVYPENISKTLLDICKPILNKLVDEINRALLFSASESHGKTISNIFLLGSFAYWKGMDSYLEKIVNIPTLTIRNPLINFEDPFEAVSKNEEAATPDLAVATGHALRGLVES